MMNRRMFFQTGVLLAGALLGMMLAEWLGQPVRMHAGRADLTAYATKLQETAAEVDQQSEAAINAVLTDGLPFCSPQEMMFMRGLVYNNGQIKDVGRVKGRTFYCSSETGLAVPPFLVPVPAASYRNVRLYVWIPVMFGDKAKGFVVQVRDANVVINPHAFDGLREPSRSYAAFVYDAPTRTLVQGFGDVLPLSSAQVIAGRMIERGGMFYQPLCSESQKVCVVAGESRRSMLAGTRMLRGILLITGASLGITLALSCILFYQRHRSPERQLRRALEREELTLVYQPIVDLETSVIVGAEALLRWTNEEGEVVSPDTFIALAEEKGLIKQVSEYVIRRAVAEMKALLEDGDFYLTINITWQDLAAQEFISFLRATLAAAKLDASAVGLELTERSTLMKQEGIANIGQLRAAGHAIYIDDFGTGYSSLAYLRDLAVDCIKIDRAFTASIGTDAVTETIIPQILRMAEQLRLVVVVEGIETSAQAKYFRSAGKGILGQGWFLGRPVSAVQLSELRVRVT